MRCFLGGLTPSGFKNQFGSFIDRTDYYGYILKGGPGTGKSSLMQRLAENCDGECDLYYCSSDIKSLDAVVFKDKKIYIADGTAPHIMEPKMPALSGEYINLGNFWDKEKIKAHSAAVEYCFAENAAFHKRASRFISAAGELFGSLYDYSSECILTEKLKAFSMRFVQKTFGKRGEGKAARETRQLSAITAQGYITHDIDPEYTIFAINDNFFAVAASILRSISDQALARGLDVFESYCRIIPSSPLEAVIIPTKKLAFVSENPINAKKYDCIKRINAMRFYDTKRLSEKKQKLSFDKSAGLELCAEASASIACALDIHDKIEEYYINAMDFSKVDEIYNKIIKEING